MSKKRGKSAVKKTTSTNSNDLLEPERVNDNSWNTHAVLVHAVKPYAMKYAGEALVEVKGGRRKRFHVLSRDFADSVCKDAVKAKGKTKDPSLAPLFEACMSGVEDGILTTQGYAQFVVAKLKQAKQAELQRRQEEEEAKRQAEQERLGLTSASSGRKSAAKGKGKGGKKGGKSNAADDGNVPGKKKMTMKTRAQEAAHIDYIDDEPLTGADQYWLLQGFSTDPNFISTLQTAGVCLSVVLNVITDDDEDDEESEDNNHTEANELEEKEGEENIANESTQEELEAQQLRTNFVAHAQTLVQKAGRLDPLKDIAWLTLDIGRAPKPWDSFNSIANIIYNNLQDAAVHQMYRNSLNLSHIPTQKPKCALDTSVYNNNLAQISPENVTVHVLLDCLLSQVVHIVDSEESTIDTNGSPKQAKGDDVHSQAESGVDPDALDAFLDEQLEGVCVPVSSNNNSEIEEARGRGSSSNVTFQDTVVVGHYDNISYKFGTERRFPYDGRRGALSVLQNSSFARKIFSSFPEEAPLTDDQRHARNQQEQKFSSLAQSRADHCKRLINMEDMLASATDTDKDAWDLSAWCVTEQLNHASLLQSIESDLQKDGSEICTWYNPSNHTVLLAVFSNMVDEIRRTNWTHVVDTKVGFSDFLQHTLPFLQFKEDPLLKDATDYFQNKEKELKELQGHEEDSLKRKLEGSIRPVSTVKKEEEAPSRMGSGKMGKPPKSLKSSRVPSSKKGSKSEAPQPQENNESSDTVKKENLTEEVTEKDRQRNATAPRGGYDLAGTLMKVVGETQYMHPYDGSVVSIDTYNVVHTGTTRRWKLSKKFMSIVLRECIEAASTGEPLCAGYAFAASFKEFRVDLPHRVIEALRTKGKSEYEKEQAALLAVMQEEDETNDSSNSNNSSGKESKGSGKKGGKERPKSNRRVQMKEDAHGDGGKGEDEDVEEKKRLLRNATPKFKPKPQQHYFQLSACDNTSATVIFHPKGFLEIACGELHKEKVALRLLREKKRFIFASGIVVRVLTNGTSMVYDVDGSVYTVRGEHDWTKCTFQGLQFVKCGNSSAKQTEKKGEDNEEEENGESEPANESEERGNINEEGTSRYTKKKVLDVSDMTIVERHAVPEHMNVLCREDNVIQVIASEVDTTTEYEDGTRVYKRNVSANFSSFRIECLGLPAVSVSTNDKIFTVSFSHGDAVYECASGHFSYTSAEDGCVLALSANGQGHLSFENERAQVHGFDFISGTYSCIDELGCEFSINDMEPSASISDRALATPLSQRCSPALYVIEDDGSGEKLLRQEDVEGYVEVYKRAHSSRDKAWKKITHHLDAGSEHNTYLETATFPNVFLRSYHEPTPLPFSLQQLVSPHLEWQHNISLLLLRQLEWHEPLSMTERDYLRKDKQVYDDWVQSMAKGTIDLDVADTREEEERETARKLRDSMIGVLRHLDNDEAVGTCIELVRPDEVPHARPSKERSLMRRQSKIMVDGWKAQLHHDDSVPNFYQCEETQELVKELENEVLNQSKRESMEPILEEEEEEDGDGDAVANANANANSDDDNDEEEEHDVLRRKQSKRIANAQSHPSRGHTPVLEAIDEDAENDCVEEGDMFEDSLHVDATHDHTSPVYYGNRDIDGEDNEEDKDAPQFIKSTLSAEDLEALNNRGGHFLSPDEETAPPHQYAGEGDVDDSVDGDSIDDGNQKEGEEHLYNPVRDNSARNNIARESPPLNTGKSDVNGDGGENAALVMQDKTDFADVNTGQILSPSDHSAFTLPAEIMPNHTDITSPGVHQRDVEEHESPQPLGYSDSSGIKVVDPVTFGIPTSAKGKRVLPEVRLKSANTLQSEAAYPHEILEKRPVVSENVPQSMKRGNPLPAIGTHHEQQHQQQSSPSSQSAQPINISVQPNKAEFGILKGGCVYSLILRVRNTGSTLCSINVREQSTPGITVSCIASKISPNMAVKITIQVDASRVLGALNDRSINSNIHIDINDGKSSINTPIVGHVLSVTEFESKKLSNRHRGKGVRLVATSKPKK
eukprot:m.213881 g.213881  ORF g.213881 m.213881 type:complete len:2015 (-) comp13794_c0_seq1:60-6104(-)